ncbi:hypothetical protein H5410_032834 [Solanum commersonii]|uniref:Uncharacterized protein n=1 Tax=Solanum commersonii TaxID=4109 RepID=A0A9J5YP16_SOLCO|nr:hypothetical protein H5410_032834 [Solanum commersonii]
MDSVCVTNAAGLWLLLEMLISSEMRGPHLVTASFEDHRSLVDVEICAISGVHIRSHHNIICFNSSFIIYSTSHYWTTDRSALKPSFSAEFIKSSQHNKDKEEEKWFNIMSLLHKPIHKITFKIGTCQI